MTDYYYLSYEYKNVGDKATKWEHIATKGDHIVLFNPKSKDFKGATLPSTVVVPRREIGTTIIKVPNHYDLFLNVGPDGSITIKSDSAASNLKLIFDEVGKLVDAEVLR